MLFKFIKYTQPAWQLNILPKTAGRFASCYAGEENIPADLLDSRFETLSARLADAGYNLCIRGKLLQSSGEDIQKLHSLPPPVLKDEYTFVRKYWGIPWATFALLLRLATLKNPFAEIGAYVSTAKIKRVDVFAHPYIDESYTAFKSTLIATSPLVAVIIPTLNRYRYLKDVLHDLEKQDYKNFEVLIFDQSDNYDADFYNQFSINIKTRHQNEKLLWTARNNAVKATNAEYLLFFDDDSRVDKNWISEHLKCLDFFNADISAGISLAAVGQKIPASYGYFRWADQFDSGNAMVKRDVFRRIGLFDEKFNGQRMGDGEFGYRAYLNGFGSISNPNASRIHLKVNSGGLREMGSWDGFRPKKWFAPKPIPSVVYLFKKYLPAALYRNAVLIGIMMSNVPYKYKRNSKMLFFSMLLTIIKSPLLVIQFSRAKRIARKMLNSNQAPELLQQ
ncbi:MAG TPA: glycosyltransferase family A protein [Chitinophagaceae bacterium]|nr:glycosyltransferase family A protein [Chitinophagaceae bacterium]